MKERGERSEWMKGKVDEIGGKIVKGWLFFFFAFYFIFYFFFKGERRKTWLIYVIKKAVFKIFKGEKRLRIIKRFERKSDKGF